MNNQLEGSRVKTKSSKNKAGISEKRKESDENTLGKEGFLTILGPTEKNSDRQNISGGTQHDRLFSQKGVQEEKKGFDGGGEIIFGEREGRARWPPPVEQTHLRLTKVLMCRPEGAEEVHRGKGKRPRQRKRGEVLLQEARGSCRNGGTLSLGQE